MSVASNQDPTFPRMAELPKIVFSKTLTHGVAGEGPVFAGLPDLRLSLIGTTTLDERLVLLDYRVSGD